MIEKIKSKPEEVDFKELIEYIDTNFVFSPLAYKNGETFNDANQNNGSLKVFSYAILNDLSKEETLNCFGDFYRNDVLKNPEGQDHQNIRNFIKFGFEGLELDKSKNGLTVKPTF